MGNTYSNKFDGYDWHNYWKQGGEQYVSCQQGGNIVSYYFPLGMKAAILLKGGNITEADLASWPAQMRGTNPLHSKRGSDSDAAVASLKQFISTEPSGARIISWLLNDNTGCCGGEHDWHEAYDDLDNFEWAWFRTWWLYPTNSP